jgi:hypothetical protein
VCCAHYGLKVNWRGALKAEAEETLWGLVEAELRLQAQSARQAEAADWLCAWCLHHVANESDRFQFDGKDEFSFANPDGIRFAIITFSQAPGCRRAGVPTLQYTWFPGHAWSFCHCDRCHQHLGWYYDGPSDFVGLIKPRIVRALAIRN